MGVLLVIKSVCGEQWFKKCGIRVRVRVRGAAQHCSMAMADSPRIEAVAEGRLPRPPSMWIYMPTFKLKFTIFFLAESSCFGVNLFLLDSSAVQFGSQQCRSRFFLSISFKGVRAFKILAPDP